MFVAYKKEDEPDASNLDVNYDWFQERVWPVLAHRLPAFERLKVKLCPPNFCYVLNYSCIK